ncbi:hypothetical protein [uncultured Methanobrevibacter sp.]|uniref:hypothetical protein n=1 Tax=uncultured Methanobrevibacter sp. TaxID=253161 RepID=UPI0025FFED09|nr:hypothetical protein [uncultured Methanobrevibacter sp.]
MKSIELEELAADLDSLIDAFGFGGEFSKQDLYDYFQSKDIMESKISQLIENELIEQNQLTGSYYFSNIVTCNMFIKKYKGESKEKPKKEKLEKTFTDSKVTIKGLIKKNELLRLIEAFEKDFEKVVLESKGDEYKVNIEINASKKEYENILEN